MPRQYSSFGRHNSKDYKQGFRDGQSSGSSGGGGGGGSASGREFLQAMAALLLFTPALYILIKIYEYPIWAALVAAFGFGLWKAVARFRETAWYQSLLPESLGRPILGPLYKLTAQYARWATPPQIDGLDAPPEGTADTLLPEDILYQRFSDTTFRCQTLLHWRRGRVWRFVTLTNRSLDSPNDVLEEAKQGASFTVNIDRSIQNESIFANDDHPLLTSLAGWIFHALKGALIGTLLSFSILYLYRGLLAKPDNSVAGMISGLLGAVLGISLAGVSRTFRQAYVEDLVRIRISWWSAALNGAVNGFLAGYIAHGVLAMGRTGFDSATWGEIVISTAFLSGNFSLLDELLFRTFSRRTASVTAALFCATLACWMMELAQLNPPVGSFASVAFVTVVGLAFVGGLSSWLVKPFGVLTGALSGCSGGALALLLYHSLELVKLGPASEFLAILKTLPGPELSKCVAVGLIAGAILGLLNFGRNEFFDKRGFQNVALGEGLFNQIPATIRTLASNVRYQFEELQVICDSRARSIVDRSWRLHNFEFLLLGRKGNNYWLIAIYPPPEEKGTEDKPSSE